MEIKQTEVEDLFGIPRDGRNIQDDSEEDLAVGDKSEASVPFEEKAKELVNDLKGISVAGLSEPKTTKETKTMPEPKKEEPKKAVGGFSDIFDDDEPTAPTPAPAPVAPAPVPAPAIEAKVEPKPEVKIEEKAPEKVVIPEGKPEPKTEKKVVETKPEMPVPPAKAKAELDWDSVPEPAPKETVVKAEKKLDAKPEKKAKAEKVEEDIVTDDSDAEEGPCQEWTSEDGWLTDSPMPKYNRFYQEKAIALGNGSRGILPGGEIPFSKYFKDLLELNCDITVQTNDLEAIHQKMQMVQQFRERCKQIQLHATQQYHLWERYIELFHGVLCRVEYERGKQDGLNFEHMRDMEHYFCSLKALHRAADQVMRTLDGAFECLSRQVTIAMPMREIERYGNTPNAGPRPISLDQKRFDALKAPVAAPSKPANSGPNMGWDL